MTVLNLANITSVLNEKSVTNFIAELRKNAKNISYRDDPESNRLAIFLNYTENTNNLEPLERECRSVILDRTTLQVISYSMDELYTEHQELLDKVLQKTVKYTINECIEGTLLAVYYFNDKWYVSTRRCLDSDKSLWLSKKSHYDMMLECVAPNFMDVLNKEYNYYFVLQHHENKGVVDYSGRFGNEYKNLVLLCVRDKKTHEEVVIDTTTLTSVGVKFPNEYQDLLLLEKEGNLENIMDKVEYEGLLVKILDEDRVKYLRLPTPRYKKKCAILPNAQNKYVAYVKLYQNKTLKEHIELFPDAGKMKHPTKQFEYDTVGVIDASFGVIVKELYNLFRLLYDLKFGQQKNKELYNLLPSSYHDVLYHIKGIFYNKRIEQKNGTIKNHKLTEKDIYNLLKTYSFNQLVFLFRGRKILRDKIVKNKYLDKRYFNLDSITSSCDPKQIMLTSVLLHLMFEKK
jgi:hypothetical protein